MNIHKPCGHCGSAMDWIFDSRRQAYTVRCRTCLCRFDVHGWMTYGSATCLRLRDKKPRAGWAGSVSGARRRTGD